MIDPEQLMKIALEIEPHLAEYLKLRQIVGRYERGKHAKLAQIIQGVQADSYAARESQAYASEAWAKYLKAWGDTEELLVKEQIKLDTLRNQFDALQSVLAYEREHMKRFG